MARICLITPHHISSQPRTLREADSLSEAGHEVRVVCRQTDTTSTGYDLRLMQSRSWTLQAVNLQRGSAYPSYWLAESLRSKMYQCLFDARVKSDRVAFRSYLKGFGQLLSLAVSEPADWFIAHTQSALPVAVAAARKWRARLGFDCEDLLSENGTDPADIVRLIQERFLPICDYVSAPSKCLGEILATTHGIEPPLVLYNVSPLSLANGLVAPRERLKGPVIRLHWFGQTIGTDRGIEEAIEALGMLADQPIELHLRGKITEASRLNLEKLACNHRVGEKLIFHPPVSPEDLVRTMDQFDIGLALERSAHGNYSLAATNKLLTYILSGLAVAASDTPGHRELMDQLPSVGFTYAAGNPRALADGLSSWTNNREQLVTAQEAAWTSGRQRFSWDIEKEKFLAVLERRQN